MNEFIEQFLVEGRELVSQGSDDLLAFEAQPGDKSRLDGAFRAFHTLKGAAGIVDFSAMAQALHAGEDVLSAVRAGSVAMSRPVADQCLACLDQVSAWLDEMQASGDVPKDAEALSAKLVQDFRQLAAGEHATKSAPTASPSQTLETADLVRHLLEAQARLLEAGDGGGALGRWQSAVIVACNVLRHGGFAADAKEIEELAEARLMAGDGVSVAQVIRRHIDHGAAVAPEAGSAGDGGSEPSVRVDVRRVDQLVRLVGELTVAKNAIGHSVRLEIEGESRGRIIGALRDQHQRLDRLVSELQRSVVGLRVIPLQNAFQRFTRLVREMSQTLAKPTRVMIEGGTVEADKSIVGTIAEPLLHIVRNALDHGIEPPDERTANGKPAIATLHLRAFREGENIVVEVEDDGRGLDIARIRAVAVERGVATGEAIQAMSDAEATNLIFASGFSTATEVSNLSGRGVGLDVVRATVERLGGRIDVRTQSGAGTAVRMVLPFTVMVTRVFTVKAAGQVFGVPIDTVIETLRVPRRSIARIGAARALVWRDQTIPIITLADVLGTAVEDAALADSESQASILVVREGANLGGLEVTSLGERLDVMLTAPEGLLANIPCIDGTTLLGDGEVLIVLDLKELLE